MGTQYDSWRLQPGEPHDENTPENWRDVNARLVALEELAAQNLHQWNAPSLVRGHGSDLLVQSGILQIQHTDWDGWRLVKSFSFPITYSVKPELIVGMAGYSVPTGYIEFVTISSWNAASAQIMVRLNTAPTSGRVDVSWRAIGKKVE